MASSALSSVIGSPLSEGSGLGFLSFAAGTAASAGKSMPSENRQAIESTTARNDCGVAEIAGNFGKKVEAGRAGSLISLSCSITRFDRWPVILKLTLPRRRSCGSPAGLSNPYHSRKVQVGKDLQAQMNEPRPR